MDLFGQIQQRRNETKELRERRRKQRLARLGLLKEAVDENGMEKQAYVWNFSQEPGSTRKIVGHPSVDSSMFVSEAFAEFDVEGQIYPRYAGMSREAGRGGFGISNGEILVDVEIRPTVGIPQRVQVPVTVKNGYMIRPGLFYHQGAPYVLSQSAIDDVMQGSIFSEGKDVFDKVDRKNLFSVPPMLPKR